MPNSKNFTLLMENKNFRDFNPVAFGHNKCSPRQHVNIATREYFLIHYVISGKGRLRLNGTWHSVLPNQIFIIPIGVENYYESDAHEPWDYIWIGFFTDFAEQFYQLPPVLDFSSNLFHEMMDVVNLNAMREEFLTEKLFALYRILFSAHMSINYVAAVQDYIKNNYMYSDISAEKIAQSLHLNRNYLSRLFKNECCCSIQEYLLSTRIVKAIDLLHMGYDVQTTASQVGYTNASSFSRMFKKHTGVSPKNYQK